MLIENSLGEFSDAQLCTVSGASTNYLDLIQVRHQLGAANPELWLWLRTNIAEDFGESETFILAFEQDADSAFSSPSCVFALCDTDGTAIATADPESTPLKTAGKTLWASTLPMTVTERYIRWYYTHTTGTAVLTVDSMLLAGPPPANATGAQIYASNVTVPS